jgi:hypothetical protein
VQGQQEPVLLLHPPLPSGLTTGPTNQYAITAFQEVGDGSPAVLTTFTGAPAADTNPDLFFFG